MSRKHPIIAVTGSSGAGTTSVQHAFAEIFRRGEIRAANVQGDSFFRYNRRDMNAAIDKSVAVGKPISHFGPEANLFDKLEELFRDYSSTGSGELRHYVKDEDEALRYGVAAGEFTAWQKLPQGADLLFYEGLHGGAVASTWTRRRASPDHFKPVFQERRASGRGIDVAQYVDLLIGVVPVINLEWIQKIHRDCTGGRCSLDAVTATILRRMDDYIHFVVPQFAVTDINFQRVPMVDTSNPFEFRDVPSADESLVVIHFRDPARHHFPSYLEQIDNAFMSRPNTMVVPGGKMAHAIEVVCTPLIRQMLAN